MRIANKQRVKPIFSQVTPIQATLSSPHDGIFQTHAHTDTALKSTYWLISLPLNIQAMSLLWFMLLLFTKALIKLQLESIQDKIKKKF